MPGAMPSTACTATTCATSIPRVPASIDVRNMSSETLRVGSRRLVEPRDRITWSSDGPSTTGTLTGGAEAHGDPRASRSPARCAAVTSGNSTGATSTCPVTAGGGGGGGGGGPPPPAPPPRPPPAAPPPPPPPAPPPRGPPAGGGGGAPPA